MKTLVSKRTAGRTRAPWITIGALLGLCCLAGLAALVGNYLLGFSGGRPLVLIHEPQNGQQLEAGEGAMIRAVASDERKIVRLELWVDGQLLESETTNVQGGISSFPLLTEWQPSSSGAHTITVRAFNIAGVRGHSTIHVNVASAADRDNDGVIDAEDSCPDEAGLGFSAGCPDQDRDGTPDAADACADTAGVPDASGCPSVTDGDRDGDGTPDASDDCPDAPGSSLAGGCPDSDGDLVADAEDGCAGEPGSAESGGCPTPSDSDGDGALDDVDACPAEWGPPELGGCPEVAPVSDDGAIPEGGGSDRDGDGAADADDPCPNDAGLPEDDYCPPPSDEPVMPEDGFIFEIPFFFFTPAFLPTPVEFEALHFEVPADYRRIWCYASLAGGDVERYEFEPSGVRVWNMDEVLGGANSVRLGVDGNEPMDVFAECYGVTSLFFPRTYYLGSITRAHAPEEWDGHVIEAESSGGEPGGHSFRVRYHLCSPSCEETELQAPVITRHTVDRDRITLHWDWEGDIRTIQGFKLYLNGNYINEIPRDTRSVSWRQSGVLCVDEWEFHLTAYGGPESFAADIESAPSNSIRWEGVPCEQHIRVTFETLDVHDPPEDEGGHRRPGPITGSCAATTGGMMESVEFDAAHCEPFPFPPFEICRGFRLEAGEYGVQGLLDWIHREIEACPSGPCFADHYSASDTDTVTVQVNPGDDLTAGCHIGDLDVGPGNENDVLFHESITVDTSDLSPDTTVTQTIPGGYLDVILKIDLFPFGE
jgi:hypothetical protein